MDMRLIEIAIARYGLFDSFILPAITSCGEKVVDEFTLEMFIGRPYNNYKSPVRSEETSKSLSFFWNSLLGKKSTEAIHICWMHIFDALELKEISSIQMKQLKQIFEEMWGYTPKDVKELIESLKLNI